jgi:hypothetical protein
MSPPKSSRASSREGESDVTAPSHLRLADWTADQQQPARAEDRLLEFITIPEWSRRVGCAADSGYRAARRNEIPGLFRIGRLMRVNWRAFVEATAQPGGQATDDKYPHAR